VIEVPSQLRKVYADVDRAAIDAWWGGLDDEARADVARLCDERADACFFGVVADERDHIVPKVRGGRFVADDDAWGFDEWGPSYFEHLIEHPELVLVWDPPERTFHTGCTRHPLAQACWSSGAVPPDFACPLANGSTCLMRPLAGRRIRWRRIC
jgi:hypothetical protein